MIDSNEVSKITNDVLFTLGKKVKITTERTDEHMSLIFKKGDKAYTLITKYHEKNYKDLSELNDIAFPPQDARDIWNACINDGWDETR